MTVGDASVPAEVVDALARIDVVPDIIACDPDHADTASFCARYGVALEDSANTIVVVSKRGAQRQAACVVLATTRLDVNRTVCRLLDVPKASFASPEQTGQITGMMIGGVTPFGLPPDLPLFIDAAVMERPSIVVGAGSRSAKLRIRPDALLRLENAQIVIGLAARPPQP